MGLPENIPMSFSEILISIALLAVGTALTRFLPFFLFPSHKKPPEYIQYLGVVLPYAVMGLLIIYCLKDAFFSELYALPEAIAIIFIVLLHLWRKNALMSIALGTVFYMILVQFIFV